MAKYCNSKYTADNAELLIPRESWCEPDELDGEEAVLRSEHMGVAFSQIMQLHTRVSDVALLSLCTATRPYSKSYKYKNFIREFGNDCDIIVNSNGGVIPIEFETSFPFMTYNAKRKNKKWDELYYMTLAGRLHAFLKQFQYPFVVANFNVQQRNYRYATDVLKYMYDNGEILGYRFAPSAALRIEYQSIEKTYHQKLNPDSHPLVLGDIKQAVQNPLPGAFI